MTAWDVYLEGRKIDTVYVDKSQSADEVRKWLIEHDGYHPQIVVRQRGAL